MAQVYRVVVRVPFVSAGRLVPRGEVLELPALEALARTHQQLATWADAPAPPKRRRRKRAGAAT